MRKTINLIATLGMLSSLAIGCSTPANQAGDIQTQTPKVVEKKEVTLKMYETAGRAAETSDLAKVIKAFTEKTGIKIQIEPVPGTGQDVYKKVDISLSAGEEIDLISMRNPTAIHKYSSNGSLVALDDMMKQDHYEAKKVFGNYIPLFDGKTFVLPEAVGKWAVFYNKKVFDDAGVPYPPASWTWDQYMDTAKKLNNPAKGIYGTYNLDYDVYLFFTAMQKGVSPYKEDGTSNFDHPAFKEALKNFGSLGNEYKIQPSWLEFKTKKLQFDGFMSGQYGMMLIGDWLTSTISDTKKYPRDWKVGITQIPVPSDNSGNRNLGIVSGYGVSKTSKHAKEAYEFVKFQAENFYKISGFTPARVDLSKEQVDEGFKVLMNRTKEGDFTLAEYKSAITDNQLGFFNEKIVGPAAAEYANIILQEGELYLVGRKSLDDTVKSIKERADKAIAAAK